MPEDLRAEREFQFDFASGKIFQIDLPHAEQGLFDLQLCETGKINAERLAGDEAAAQTDQSVPVRHTGVACDDAS